MSALPVLADNLLRIELETQEVPAQNRVRSTGIRDVDKGISGTVWTGGKVTGVASEKGSSLSEHIISEHLLSSQENIGQRRGVTNGFIIAPHSSAIVTSIHSTLVDRLSTSVVPTQSTAVQYLESVQLLQYFDFAGLTESVAEVSSRQFALSNAPASQKTILYIEGLDVMIEGTQRRSGLVQANALLSSLLRTLVLLSRTYPCLLVLLDLRLREDSKGDEATLSAFASAIGSDMRLQCGGALGRTLDAGLDVLVLVHDAHGIATTGSAVVEVVKDRVDDALGEWAVWKYR